MIILGNFARTLYGGATDWEETGALLAIYLVLIAVMTAVVYPLLYRFGSERGRMIQMALMILFMVAAGVLGGLALEPAALDLLRGRGAALVFALLPGIAAVLFLLSFLLSVRWYRYVTPD